MNNLLKFWNEAKLDAAPFVHPRDVIPQKHIQSGVSSYADFLRAFESGTLSKPALHLSLLPQPYFGDLDNADILILLINPGLSACDYHAEENYPAFRESLIASIRQEKRGHIFLDPTWAWTSGFVWWESKLRDVARLIASERFDGHYGRALSDLSRRVASVELVPYHSFNFGTSKRLASSLEACRFVANADPKRTIIVTRSVSNWGLSDAPNIIKYPASHARGASLGLLSAGGRAILMHYGIFAAS